MTTSFCINLPKPFFRLLTVESSPSPTHTFITIISTTPSTRPGGSFKLLLLLLLLLFSRSSLNLFPFVLYPTSKSFFLIKILFIILSIQLSLSHLLFVLWKLPFSPFFCNPYSLAFSIVLVRFWSEGLERSKRYPTSNYQ